MTASPDLNDEGVLAGVFAVGARQLAYHGGAPGFKAGDLIEPHSTKHLEGCAWCASGRDDNHRPDRVFITAHRLYAKHYASKWGSGSLYVVEPVGEAEPSAVDSFPSWMAPAVRIVRVAERCVTLSMSERRHLWRSWKAADEAAGKPAMTALVEMAMKARLGIRR